MASTMAEDGTESNKAARDPPSNGTSALRRKRIIRSHQQSENREMAENVKSGQITENSDASSQVQAAMKKRTC